MKKIFSPLVIAATLISTFTFTTVYAQDVLKFATEAAYPPFNERAADGSIIGFEIDLGMAMCKKINRQCEFIAQEWDGMIPGLLARKYDGIFASMAITEDRKDKIDFSNKYYQTSSTFIAKKDANIDFSDPVLGGINVGTVPGVTECYLRKFYPNINLRLFKNAENMYLDLESSRIDAIVSDSVQADFGLLRTERGAQMVMVGEPLADQECFGEGIGIGIRKDDSGLRDELNEAIQLIRDDGTYNEIMSRYFDYDIYGQ